MAGANVKIYLTAIICFMLLFHGCGRNHKAGENTAGSVSVYEQKKLSYWFDKETSTVHTILYKNGEKRIVSIIKYRDGEPLEIMKIIRSDDKNGRLQWTYFVPSTKYIVELKTVSITGNEITFEWKNRSSEGDVKSGLDILTECNQYGIVSGKNNGER